MTTLNILQNQFQAYLIDQDPLSIMASIHQNTKLSDQERLEIYYNAYRFRLLDVLIEDFPKLYKLLGDTAFKEIGVAYIKVQPSSHFSLRYFGQHLSRFIEDLPEYSSYPYLVEMAIFEWELSHTLDALDDEVLEVNVLNSIAAESWGDLRIQFHPACRLLTLKWNVPQLWKSLDEESTPVLPTMAEPILWVLWRKGLNSHFRSLTPEQSLAYKTLQKHNFAELCEQFCEIMDEEEVPKQALGFIQQCFQEGMVSKILFK